MAGSSFEITIEDAKVRELLSGLAKAVGNLRPEMATIGRDAPPIPSHIDSVFG